MLSAVPLALYFWHFNERHYYGPWLLLFFYFTGIAPHHHAHASPHDHAHVSPRHHAHVAPHKHAHVSPHDHAHKTDVSPKKHVLPHGK